MGIGSKASMNMATVLTRTLLKLLGFSCPLALQSPVVALAVADEKGGVDGYPLTSEESIRRLKPSPYR